ncbi:MAG TPA: protein kinase [Myxococcota bacterium]|nr:protein kinase [Myxococcota bacterium]
MRIQLLQKIGDGQVAEVRLGRVQTDAGPSLVTVYRLLRQVIETSGLIDRLQEASARIISVRHENLLRHLGFGQYQGDFFWVDERGEGFDLATVLNRLSSREVHINHLRSLQIGMDFTRGLGALHEHELVFGGMSPEYVVTGFDGITRLGGAGLESTLFATKELKQRTRRGRSGLLAPEVMQGRDATHRSDVFGAAAIVYALLTGSEPLGKEERSGVGISVRHVGVQPPSKLDRTLPFSCDAVFIKALNTSSNGRHDSGTSLANALKRLRAAMLKGPDRGHEEVSQFIDNLFPNEAVIAGMRGTTAASSVAGEIEIEGPDVDETSAEPTRPPAPVSSAPAPAATPKPAEIEQPGAESAPADPDAAARVAAWEAAMGNSSSPKPSADTASRAPMPPPLPGQNKASGPSPLVEVNWDGLDEEPTEDRPAPGLAYDDGEQTPSEPRRPADDEIRQEYDTLVTTIPPAGDASAKEPKKRRSRLVWILAGIALLALAAVIAISMFSTPEKERKKPEALTALGFLSVQTPRPARVTLDGELLPQKTPIVDRVVRAGEHRLLLQTIEGKTITDETFSIEAGEHKAIRLIGSTTAEPQVPAAKNGIKKPTRKKRRHNKRQTRRRRRVKTRK